MTLKTNDDRLTGTACAVMLLRSDLDTLCDVAIAQTTELRTNQILDSLHLRVEKLFAILLRQLENRIVLPEFIAEFFTFLNSFW